MLHAFVSRHPQVQTMGDVLLFDQSFLDRQFATGLFQEIERVVEEHAADDHDDENHIDRRHEIKHGTVPILARGGLGTHVYFADGESRIGARMTLPAGLDQVGFIDRRRGIAGGFDRVRSVAARAIHHFDRTAAHRESVVTVGKRLERIRRQSVFLRQPERRVTIGTNFLRDVLLVDRRGRVLVTTDVVLAVTIRTRRRIEVPLPQGRGMRALAEFVAAFLVARRTCIGDSQFVDARISDHRAVHLVSAVTIHAVGRIRVAIPQGCAVHTLVERGYELNAAQSLSGNFLFFHVTRFALARLRELLHERQLFARDRDNRLSVTGQTIRRVGLVRRKHPPVRRGGKMIASLLVALAAGFDLRSVAKREGLRLDGLRIVFPVTRDAIGIPAPGNLLEREPGMKCVLLRRIVVAGDAIDGHLRFAMRGSVAVVLFVTIYAAERFVRGVRNGFFIDEEGDFFPLFLHRQFRIRVAFETALVAIRLRRGIRLRAPKPSAQSEENEPESPG